MKRVGVAAMMVAVGIACTSSPGAPDGTPVQSPVSSAPPLVYCSEGDPEGFDPALYTSGTTLDASSRQIYNRLVQFKPGSTELVPALAHSWHVSDDGLEYTFYLRSGVSFHTTRDFTPSRNFDANDVVFSFQRQLDVDHDYNNRNLYPASYEYFQSMSMPEILKDVVAVDDHTVKFVLHRPEAPMLVNLAMDFASILSEEYADQMLAEGTPEKLNLAPVGTGPYRLERYRPSEVIRYRAHDDYWAGKARTVDLVFAITYDASVRYQRLRAGECHVMPFPNPSDIESMRNDPDIDVLEQEGLNVGYLAYNTRMPPFDKPEVRLAATMAIDKQAIINAVFRGTAVVAKNPIPPSMWSYNEAVKDDLYDPEGAKALLAEAGVAPSELTTKIWAMNVQRPYNPNPALMAELIQANWAAIGVEAAVVVNDWPYHLQASMALDRDGVVLLGWSADNGDPDNFLGLLLGCAGVGGTNRAHWCHEPFERLVQRARVLGDQSERMPLYEEAQLIFKAQAPWATIAHSVVHEPVRANVRGYRVDPLGGHYFYGVWLAD